MAQSEHQPALAPSPAVTGARQSAVADAISVFSTNLTLDDVPVVALDAAGNFKRDAAPAPGAG